MSDTGNTISNLRIDRWRQFDNIDINFHRNLTIITGANGSGKSTILNIISRHFGWNRQFLAIPRRVRRNATYEYFTSMLDWEIEAAFAEQDMAVSEADAASTQPPRARAERTAIGLITYSNGEKSTISVPTQGQMQYNIVFDSSQPVEGVYVSPNRPSHQYRRVDQIPTEPLLPALAYKQLFDTLVNSFAGNHVPHPPLFKIKQALISMALFGPGNQNSPAIPEIERSYNGFIDILREILPKTLGFQTISIRSPDVIFVTKSGEWPIDDASGGVSALIELAWQIFLFAEGRTKFVAAIDEPENHLHPAMQRSVLGNLVRAFPAVQFIVATHSPLIISSVKDSTVYALKYRDLSPKNLEQVAPNLAEDTRSPQRELPLHLTTRVVSEKLDLVARAGTAAEVLRDVLGVPVTTPEWVVDELERVIEVFRSQPFSAETLALLKQQLEQIGMGEQFPAAVARLVDDP